MIIATLYTNLKEKRSTHGFYSQGTTTLNSSMMKLLHSYHDFFQFLDYQMSKYDVTSLRMSFTYASFYICFARHVIFRRSTLMPQTTNLFYSSLARLQRLSTSFSPPQIDYSNKQVQDSHEKFFLIFICLFTYFYFISLVFKKLKLKRKIREIQSSILILEYF